MQMLVCMCACVHTKRNRASGLTGVGPASLTSRIYVASAPEPLSTHTHLGGGGPVGGCLGGQHDHGRQEQTAS